MWRDWMTKYMPGGTAVCPLRLTAIIASMEHGYRGHISPLGRWGSIDFLVSERAISHNTAAAGRISV